jgi:hypothetical protein
MSMHTHWVSKGWCIVLRDFCNKGTKMIIYRQIIYMCTLLILKSSDENQDPFVLPEEDEE